jgi:hypothetical protein
MEDAMEARMTIQAQWDNEQRLAGVAGRLDAVLGKAKLLTRAQQREIVADMCAQLGWDSRPLAIGSDGKLTDGVAWETARRTESALREQVQQWNGGL